MATRPRLSLPLGATPPRLQLHLAATQPRFKVPCSHPYNNSSTAAGMRAGLCAVEGGQGGGAIMGQPLGRRPARLAHRMFRDDRGHCRGAAGPALGWRGPQVPPPRQRDCAERGAQPRCAPPACNDSDNLTFVAVFVRRTEKKRGLAQGPVQAARCLGSGGSSGASAGCTANQCFTNCL